MAAHTADALRQLNVLAAVYTGCASFRNQALQQWPSAGPTDVYGSVEAHRAMVAAQLATGVLLDDSMFYTDARISTRYPMSTWTRRTRPSSGLSPAAWSRHRLMRGRPTRRRRPAPVGWCGAPRGAPPAARCMVRLLHPLTSRPQSARDIVALFLDHVRPALADCGDEEWVESSLAVFWNHGNGARSQRSAWERSKDGSAVVRDAIAQTLA